MKRITILFILFLAATFGSIAQDYQEVVYLTDGSIIKGFIIEQVPNDYLKIETPSGKVYLIEMYEVERIAKERPRTGTQNNRGQNINQRDYNNNRNSAKYRQNYDEDDYDYYRDYSYFPNKGYKGFIDIGFSFGTKTKIDSYSYDGDNRFEFSTSHGYFFSPYLFIGAGFGVHFYTGYNYDGDYHSYDSDESFVEIPIFAHIRSHFIDKKVSPFADVKLGYSVYDATGPYFTPSVGCRFAKGSRSAFWLSLGYTIQQFDQYNADIYCDAFSMKVGWDF
ncbi:MAG: hypothetical protein LBV74_03425 [Tannerella sp.]|jgi:hypothetical protein|nr:hypothetical protein [Tannerella sp.]